MVVVLVVVRYKILISEHEDEDEKNQNLCTLNPERLTIIKLILTVMVDSRKND